MASLRCGRASCVSSASLSFLKLSAARSFSTSAPAAPFLLDFLLPRRAVAPVPRGQGPPARPTRLIWTKETPSAALTGQRRFGTSARLSRTVVVHNNQKDEDGNDMLLEITPRAAKRLGEIMARDSNPDLALRVQVESGGCHGFQYLMSLATATPDTLRDDDTILSYIGEEAAGEGDDTAGADHNGLGRPKIILDTPSLELLKGSKVDFTMELIGSQFKIVDNPLATSSCGCGTSFDIQT